MSHGTAQAVLLDHGPADPKFLWPTWYRDTNGLALQECLSPTPSPNGLAGGLPMCFPPNPDPAGFAGNVGPEVFFSDLNVILGKGTAFRGRYIAAVEATYLPAGTPIHGTETVFARIRISMDLTVAGTYTVTHPYGVETFVVRPFELGPRAVFFTADVPLGPPMDFDTVLKGQIGPFPQWDVINPGESLSVTNPATGVVETWVGDPNFPHTYTGSPFGTNYVRVDGPPGSNLDGLGNSFIVETTGAVLGQKYTAAIPTPTTIKRASYARDPVKNLISVDVFATSAPASKMIVTGVNLPTTQMVGDAAGNYFAHIEMPATVIPPASIQVNNFTSNPVNIVTAGLVDQLEITTATYDSLTRALKVTATSSDQSVPPPALTVVGPFGGPMIAGAFTGLVPATSLPPERIAVQSSAGGIEEEEVTVLPGLPTNKTPAPVAVADVITTPQNTAVSLDVTANDALAPGTLVGQVLVIVPPANGKAAPIGINTGVVTYTPALNFFGTDTFQYVVLDTAGAVSNVATVTVTVTFTAAAPTAFADDFAMLVNRAVPLASRRYNVVANDVATPGTTINPASVTITTAPLHGSAVANGDGTITYTPALNFIGTDTLQYTVANNFGTASAPGTVTIVVEGAAEVLTIKKANFTVAKNAWNIVGTTNWFGPQLLHTVVTCWIGRGIAVGPLIGSVTVDTLGTFTLVPPPLTTPAPDATNLFTCQSSNGGVVTGIVSRI